MTSVTGEDGRWHHSVRQSWLDTFDRCPERARQDDVYPEDRRETDAANIGTAVHVAIEVCIRETLDLHDTLYVFEQAFDELTQLPNFVWVKYNRKTALAFGVNCTRDWYEHVRPSLHDDALLEYEFRVPLIDDEQRVIECTGTMDYLTRRGIIDWKTTGSGPYTPWEKRRWAIQPTIYTYAAACLDLCKRDRVTKLINFDFCVLQGNGHVQHVPVQRGPEDWLWLQQKATSAAKLIEAQLDEWPKMDNHALCSPKWCNAWAKCKGASYASITPSSW